MKVAYFAFSERYGASDAGFVHVYNIVKNLAREIDVRLFIRGGEAVEGSFEIVDVTLPSLENVSRTFPSRYIRNYLDILRKTMDVEIVHERFHVNPVDLFFVGDRKYVLEVNDPGIETWAGLRRLLYSPLVRLKFRRCDAIITQTETLRAIIAKHTDKPIYVVPNGVDTDRFNPSVESDLREGYGVKDEDILVTYVGSFREWHGVQDIPRIAERIKRRDVWFLLVGAGPMYEEVKKSCRGNDRIIFTGAMPPGEIPGILAASDILIAPFNPSRFGQLEEHGFWWSPVKLYEYMASGRAIVSYNFGEVGSIVGDAGLLADPRDLEGIISKLLLLIEDKTLREKLGARAREVAVGEYGWDRRAEEVLNIYKGLVNSI